MLLPLFSKVAGRFLALTSESCDGLAREQNERVWGSQLSSLKLSSRSSRNAKLRPISKRKLSSFPRSFKVRSETDRHVYEVIPRKDKRGVDLISDALPFGPLWYGEPNAVSNTIGYAMHCSRSHDAVIRVYDAAGNVIEKDEGQSQP
jgi:hypothetical protein